MVIRDNSVVSFHYQLTDEAGEILDASAAEHPLTYLHGAGNIIPGLEDALTGKGAGAELSVTVQPEEGYGIHRPDLIQEVPRQAFPEPDKLEAGMQFNAQSDRGAMPVVITKVSADTVTVDGNHPLAGKVLRFEVRIATVRDASPEEIAHGHVHGPGGQHH
jgi:FKBP-type peptidyl-prolyl cis-trans isomerase SlyD